MINDRWPSAERSQNCFLYLTMSTFVRMVLMQFSCSTVTLGTNLLPTSMTFFRLNGVVFSKAEKIKKLHLNSPHLNRCIDGLIVRPLNGCLLCKWSPTKVPR